MTNMRLIVHKLPTKQNTNSMFRH